MFNCYENNVANANVIPLMVLKLVLIFLMRNILVFLFSFNLRLKYHLVRFNDIHADLQFFRSFYICHVL